MNAKKYLKWYRHFRAHMQDPETARANALAWTADGNEAKSHQDRFTGYWSHAGTATHDPEPPEPAQPQPAPRKRRRSYTDPTTPTQPTLF